MGTRSTTRAALQTAALTLFLERGYDQTPTAEIARLAGVSEMTLFRHFSNKASFLVEDPYDPVIADAVRARPAAEHALTATVRGIGDAWTLVPPPAADEVRTRLRIIAVTPSLRSALATGTAATERAISDALGARGVAPEEAVVVAAAVVAALNAALIDWSQGDEPDMGRALRTVFRALGEE